MVGLFPSLLLLLVGTNAILVPVRMLAASKYPQAKCMDGTQAGYYYQEAPASNDRNKWIIYLNGGGECDTQGNWILCYLNPFVTAF